MKHFKRIASLMVCFSVFGTISCSFTGISHAQNEQSGQLITDADKWTEVSEKLDAVSPVQTQPVNKDLVVTKPGEFGFTEGMLMGNGSVGVVSDARPDEQGYYISGVNTWNNTTQLSVGRLMITPKKPYIPAWENNGAIGGSLKFTGNEYITIPKNHNAYGFNARDNYTLSFWIKPNDLLGIDALIANETSGDFRNSFYLYSNTNTLNLQYGYNGTAPTADGGVIRNFAAIQANSWQHIAVVKQGQSIKTYFNGVFKAGVTLPAGKTITPLSNSPLNIGDNSGNLKPFTGGMDELRIYGSALTPEQITNEYNKTGNAGISKLLDLNFNENQGNLVNDAANNVKLVVNAKDPTKIPPVLLPQEEPKQSFSFDSYTTPGVRSDGVGQTYNDWYGYNCPLASAFDSDDKTMWISHSQAARSDGNVVPHDKWISVKGALPFTFNKLEIKHNGAYFPDEQYYNTYAYEIQKSDDGVNWTTIKSVTNNTDPVNIFEFSEKITAKELRLYITEPVHPGFRTKNFTDDKTNSRIVDVNIYNDDANVINNPVPVKNFYHKQDIKNAEVSSRIPFDNKELEIKSWLSDNIVENMLVTELKLPDGATENVDVKLQLTNPSTQYSTQTSIEDNKLCLTRSGTATNFPLRMAVATGVTGGTAVPDSDGKSLIVTVKPNETITLVTHISISMEQPASPKLLSVDQVKTRVKDRVSSTTVDFINTARQKHLDWWKNYWTASYVELNDTMYNKFYYGALYAMGCVIRPELDGADTINLPSALYGAWNTSDDPKWGFATLNYNFEASYYGYPSANRGELLIPYFDQVAKHTTHLQNATANAGYQGAQVARAIAPVQRYFTEKAPITPAAVKNPGALPTDQKSNMMIYTVPLIWDYYYYGNTDRLNKYIYPVITEAVKFFMDYVEKGDDGRYWVNASSCYESLEARNDKNPLLDIGYIKYHFKAFIDMSEKLGLNSDLITKAEDILNNLSPYPTTRNSPVAKAAMISKGFDYYNQKELIIAGYKTNNITQILASNNPWGDYIYEGNQPVVLEGVVHPAENVSLASDPKEVKLVKDTFEYINALNPFTRGGGYNGVPKTYTIAARIGWDADDLYNKFRRTMVTLLKENLRLYSGHGIESIGAIEAVNSMLLQNESDELRVFPSWPKSKDAKFTDLRAKGAFLVSSELQAGKVKYINVKSENRGRINIVSPWVNGIIVEKVGGSAVDAAAGATKFTGEELYSFETEPNAAYIITENPNAPVPVTDITVLVDKTNILVGETVTASAIALPKEAGKKLIRWTSSDDDIALVTQQGAITGYSKGTATITAMSVSNPEIRKEIQITVNDVLPEKITITGLENGVLEIGKSVQLAAVIEPSNPAINTSVQWSVQNPELVQIDQSGRVTALKSGKTAVTATSVAKPDLKASIELTVNPPELFAALSYQKDIPHSIVKGNYNGSGWTMGYEFNLKTPVTIQKLGFYDTNEDGEYSNPDSSIIIWDGNKNAVVNTQITTGSAIKDDDGYCYATLETPVRLQSGKYVIGGYYPLDSQGKDVWFHANGVKPFTTPSQLEYVQQGYTKAEGIQYLGFGSGYPYFCINFKFTDKEELEQVLNTASGYQETEYRPESWTQLQSAIAKGIAVKDNDKATQIEIAAAVFTVNDAIKGLVSIYTPVITTDLPGRMDVKTGDKVTFGIEASITSGGAVSVTSGSALTYEWYKDGIKIDGADAPSYIINSASVTDSGSYRVKAINTVGNAAYSTNSTSCALKVNVDKTGLLELYNTGIKLRQGNYTDESLKVLQNVINLAKAVIDNAYATEPEVADACASLNMAFKGLVMKPDPTTEPAPTPLPTPTPAPDATVRNTNVIFNGFEPDANGHIIIGVKAGIISEALRNAAANEDNIRQIALNVESRNLAREYSLTIPIAELAASAHDVELAVNTNYGSTVLPADTVRDLTSDKIGTIVLTVSSVDKASLSDGAKEVIGNRPVVTARLSCNGVNKDADIKMAVNYIPSPSELADYEHLIVYKLEKDGSLTVESNGRYNRDTRQVTVDGNLNEVYAVGFVKKTFEDTSAFGWADKQISVLASKGILGGTSESTYSPEMMIKRADFLKLLVDTLNLKAAVAGNFSDIPEDAYYSDEIAIAKALGITSGTGNNKFYPDEKISRQDMMVLVDRALKIAKKPCNQGNSEDLQKYDDAGIVAGYARDSISSLVKEGIILGAGGCIDPQGSTTRAQAAVILYKLYYR